ncbi:Ig-like domain-containing protein [Roseovarius dicentrarchi]|uniref:Ig-like domain-containing protein n=1 Tax=Roseovarius dicentrarchi TaxID=2250573 RepID=UPI000DE822CF|nr:Ig-like domain-containing protein [Roseovarius dicentrarchi]
MKAIKFVVRTRTGESTHGEVSIDGNNSIINVSGSHEVSLNLTQDDIGGYTRVGNDLEITLADGRVIELTNYFADAGGETRLFISADGYLNEVVLVDGGDGALYAQYGPTAEWSKWSPSDELIFLGGTEVASDSTGEDETVSMLGAGILGGSSLLGLGAAGAAAVVGGAAIMGGDGGDGNHARPSGPTKIQSSVDQDAPIIVGGDGVDGSNTSVDISGDAEPGSTVEVTVGDKTQETTADDDGYWDVSFGGDDLPEDGTHDVVVDVREPDGTETTLTGPEVQVDTTPPDAALTGGTVGTDDLFNAEAYENGVDIAGTGEPGSSITVTVDDIVRETVVDGDGNWTVTYEPGALPKGEVVLDLTVVAKDAVGNTTTVTDSVQIDTVFNDLAIDLDEIEGDGTVNGNEASGGIDITGTATAGATVVVTFNDEDKTVTAGTDGKWTAQFDGSGLGDIKTDMDVSATTTDAAGNVTTTSGQIHVDTFLNDFTQTSTTGGDDGVINAAEATEGLTVTGTGEPGMQIEVTLAGVPGVVEVAGDGSWTASFDASQIPAGTRTETMIATATDAAGNSETITSQVQIDTEAGLLTLETDAIGGADGVINYAEAEAGVIVSGDAPEGMLVTVLLDGVRHEVTAGLGNVWQTTYQQHEIVQGTHTPDVSASITDAAGNSARVDATVRVDTVVDDLSMATPPLVTATDQTSVINGDLYRAGFDVNGTVEPGSTVEVSIGRVGDSARVQGQVEYDGNGNWTATFPANALPEGQYDAAIKVDARDAAGNVDSVTQTFQVDTQVDALSHARDLFGDDRVVNLAEAEAGITLTGQVEPGSTVQVNVLGKTYDAVVSAAGAWTLDIPDADIPQVEGAAGMFDMTITATDNALNVSTISETLTIDTIAPDTPDVVGYFRQGGGYRYVTLDTPDDPVAIHKVAGDGSVSEMDLYESADAFLGETSYHFLDGAGRPAPIADGSQLVVTSNDAAGNASSTYLVLDETNTNVVNLGNSNLGDFQIETIDLSFGDQSQLVLTKELVESLSDATDTVVVRGGADDTVTMLGAARGDSIVVDGDAHTVYTLGDATQILVDDQITNIVI